MAEEHGQTSFPEPVSHGNEPLIFILFDPHTKLKTGNSTSPPTSHYPPLCPAAILKLWFVKWFKASEKHLKNPPTIKLGFNPQAVRLQTPKTWFILVPWDTGTSIRETSGELDAIWSSGSAQARAAALSSGGRNWRQIARILGLPAASLRSFTSIFPHLILRCKYLTSAPKEENESISKSQRIKGMNPGLVSPFLQLLSPFLVPSIRVCKKGQSLEGRTAAFHYLLCFLLPLKFIVSFSNCDVAL